ncbi:hypothetical protein EVAR_17707_1 [Eumeta japonica]|uniref:Uncharacterized protein n=1 Tax=Eumeta variegata TaxID=151549 RepID=A0A4C1US71_EUMVA|nr:hypothetical protein EVAR_17707_1 [Eumeta japonica]
MGTLDTGQEASFDGTSGMSSSSFKERIYLHSMFIFVLLGFLNGSQSLCNRRPRLCVPKGPGSVPKGSDFVWPTFGGARRRRRRRPPTASRLKGPRKQKSFAYKLLKRGLAKSFAYKLLKRGLANLMSPTSTSGVAPPLAIGINRSLCTSESFKQSVADIITAMTAANTNSSRRELDQCDGIWCRDSQYENKYFGETVPLPEMMWDDEK